jgi:Domain of unknown function (DUF4158)
MKMHLLLTVAGLPIGFAVPALAQQKDTGRSTNSHQRNLLGDVKALGEFSALGMRGRPNLYGIRSFTLGQYRSLAGWLLSTALQTSKGVALVRVAIEELRRRSVIILRLQVLERFCAETALLMDLTVLRMRLKLRKGHESPRQSLPDLTPCGRPLLATARCSGFATDGSMF